MNSFQEIFAAPLTRDRSETAERHNTQSELFGNLAGFHHLGYNLFDIGGQHLGDDVAGDKRSVGRLAAYSPEFRNIMRDIGGGQFKKLGEKFLGRKPDIFFERSEIMDKMLVVIGMPDHAEPTHFMHMAASALRVILGSQDLFKSRKQPFKIFQDPSGKKTAHRLFQDRNTDLDGRLKKDLGTPQNMLLEGPLSFKFFKIAVDSLESYHAAAHIDIAVAEIQGVLLRPGDRDPPHVDFP